MVSALDKLPFKLGSDARRERYKEAFEKNEKPIEVNCISLKDVQIVRGEVVFRGLNEKTGRIEEWPGFEYLDICPICGKLMLIRVIKGTTWLALCSKECYERYIAPMETEAEKLSLEPLSPDRKRELERLMKYGPDKVDPEPFGFG